MPPSFVAFVACKIAGAISMHCEKRSLPCRRGRQALFPPLTA